VGEISIRKGEKRKTSSLGWVSLQFRGAVLLIVRLLLLANTAEIPEDDSSVVAGTSEDACLVRVPRDGRDSVMVALQSVNLFLDVTKIPDTNGLVSRRSGNQHLGGGVKGQRVDSVTVTMLGDKR
jgi:hypothetical protein